MEEPKSLIEWKTIVIPPMKESQCQHYFEFVDGECRCKYCKLGLMGVVTLEDGKPVK